MSPLEPQPRDPTRIALGEKDIVVGRPKDAVRAIENRPAASKPLAFGADLLQARHHVADIGAALVIAPARDGLVEPAPGFEVVGLAVENLHAVQSGVDHDDAAVRKGPDRVRPAELTVARPVAAPSCDQGAGSIEAMDPARSIAVRDIDVAPNRDMHVGGRVEGPKRHAALAYPAEPFARWRADDHLMHVA